MRSVTKDDVIEHLNLQENINNFHTSGSSFVIVPSGSRVVMRPLSITIMPMIMMRGTI